MADLKAPEGVEILTEPELLIVKIDAIGEEAEEEPEPVAGEEEAVEGEEAAEDSEEAAEGEETGAAEPEAKSE